MKSRVSYFSLRRLKALCWKEMLQIMRDPSSIVIAIILPVLLLFLFGYGVNLDTNRLRVGLVLEDGGAHGQHFAQSVIGSPYMDVVLGSSRAQMQSYMDEGGIRGMLVVPSDFSSNIEQGHGNAQIQVIADGSQPNTANFVVAYAQGVWLTWQEASWRDAAKISGGGMPVVIEPVVRYWFNPTTVSRNYLIPGSISVVMTIIGALLTSMVIAREWERGTMEALLATPVTRLEFLLSKIIPYYILGMMAMGICVLIATSLMNVPLRGPLWLLFIAGSLFMGCALGMGLLISTLTRNQFNAAQAALNVAFLPAVMLSGFVFEIASMPKVIQVVTYIFPARYFVSISQTLFQA
ncbi:MAG: ABC transporter permease, partial [Saezia sp.]